jgi:hypothetical protein
MFCADAGAAVTARKRASAMPTAHTNRDLLHQFIADSSRRHQGFSKNEWTKERLERGQQILA